MFVAGGGGFAEEWSGGKGVVPVVAVGGVDRALAQRCAAAARKSGFDHYSVAALDVAGAPADLVPITDLVRPGRWVLVLPDRSGAVLTTARGYALAAGGPRFHAGFSPGGQDRARIAFHRAARRLADRFPDLPDVAARHPVETPVDRGPHTLRQVELMRELARGAISPADLAERWFPVRRAAARAGERTGEPLTTVLDRVFTALDDRSTDPALRERDDDALVTYVRDAVVRLSGAASPGRRGVRRHRDHLRAQLNAGDVADPVAVKPNVVDAPGASAPL
ncbi:MULTISPECIES: hypothetical protein [Actinosynnema]|uniref:hypothetical protein n=1 Tax=Actinosynnema TaxID=40566 RepID=UPI0020A40576|nr:hypothetical protein [Actinosynnema pretiosum]